MADDGDDIKWYCAKCSKPQSGKPHHAMGNGTHVYYVCAPCHEIVTRLLERNRPPPGYDGGGTPNGKTDH